MQFCRHLTHSAAARQVGLIQLSRRAVPAWSARFHESSSYVTAFSFCQMMATLRLPRLAGIPMPAIAPTVQHRRDAEIPVAWLPVVERRGGLRCHETPTTRSATGKRAASTAMDGQENLRAASMG